MKPHPGQVLFMDTEGDAGGGTTPTFDPEAIAAGVLKSLEPAPAAAPAAGSGAAEEKKPDGSTAEPPKTLTPGGKAGDGSETEDPNMGEKVRTWLSKMDPETRELHRAAKQFEIGKRITEIQEKSKKTLEALQEGIRLRDAKLEELTARLPTETEIKLPQELDQYPEETKKLAGTIIKSFTAKIKELQGRLDATDLTNKEAAEDAEVQGTVAKIKEIAKFVPDSIPTTLALLNQSLPEAERGDIFDMAMQSQHQYYDSIDKALMAQDPATQETILRYLAKGLKEKHGFALKLGNIFLDAWKGNKDSLRGGSEIAKGDQGAAVKGEGPTSMRDARNAVEEDLDAIASKAAAAQ